MISDDLELLGLFIATWGMILPLYYYLGELKTQLRQSAVCRRATVKKELDDEEDE